ncbi:MAG: DNA-binding response regulator, partial [Bacteroidetes bacterium]
PHILVVEDEEEVQSFLLRCLQDQYHLLSASNGEEALRLARTHMPDLVLSDVMMPGMDGHQLCQALKQDLNTSHIPVILLTARNTLDHQLEGLATGADAYVTKPFHTQVLKAQIANLIRSRQALRIRFAGGEGQAVELASTHLDEAFIQDLVHRIEVHLSEPDFRVQDLAREMGMSHSALYRKIKSLTGHTAKEFLINLRLRHAAKLLQAGGMNISEVAFAVGFSDPKYFSTSFKKQYGTSPSSYPVATT